MWQRQAPADHIGKKESQESGEYPLELCDAYARLLMEHFRMMAEAEYQAGRLLGFTRTRGLVHKRRSSNADERAAQQGGGEVISIPRTTSRP